MDACDVGQAEPAPRLEARTDIDNFARPPRDLTPNPELRTPNSELRTPNSELQP